MELTLSGEEQELLLRILEQHHRELVQEIGHTDHRAFKEDLRRREKLLESILGRLATAVPGSRG